MTTTVIKIKGTTAPAGLPVINVTADEYAIINVPSLLEWFRADTGITGVSAADFRWAGRKNGYQLKAVDIRPVLSSVTQNGKPVLKLGNTSGVYDGDARAMMPMDSDYSIAVVARAESGDNACIVGNQATDHSFLQRSSSNTIIMKHKLSSSANELSSSAMGSLDPANLVLIVVSYDFAAKALTATINGAFTMTKASGVADLLDSSIAMGWAGPVPTPGYGQFVGEGGVAEALFFNKALHKPEYAAQLALVQDYLAARYAI